MDSVPAMPALLCRTREHPVTKRERMTAIGIEMSADAGVPGHGRSQGCGPFAQAARRDLGGGVVVALAEGIASLAEGR